MRLVSALPGPVYDRLAVRIEEMHQSLRIIEQVTDELQNNPGPVMIADKKIAWPAQLAVGGVDLALQLHALGDALHDDAPRLALARAVDLEGDAIVDGELEQLGARRGGK